MIHPLLLKALDKSEIQISAARNMRNFKGTRSAMYICGVIAARFGRVSLHTALGKIHIRNLCIVSKSKQYFSGAALSADDKKTGII